MAFQLRVGELLQQLTSQAVSAAVHVGSEPEGPDTQRKGTSAWDMPELRAPEDLATVKKILGLLSEKERRAIAVLLLPGRKSAGDVLTMAGWEVQPRARGGVFRGLAQPFKDCGRCPIWRGGEQSETGMMLHVPDGGPRDLFLAVLELNYEREAEAVGLIFTKKP